MTFSFSAAEPGIEWGAADVSIAPWQQRSCTVCQDYWKPIKTVQLAVLGKIRCLMYTLNELKEVVVASQSNVDSGENL